ncbi:MAG: hypothetical protein ACI9J5_003733 [Paraglaciecola sp.]|jgi:hypothetical protein
MLNRQYILPLIAKNNQVYKIPSGKIFDVSFHEEERIRSVTQWINFRSISLLEQMPPCQVLVIMLKLTIANRKTEQIENFLFNCSVALYFKRLKFKG